MTRAESVLADVLTGWERGFNAAVPGDIAALFSADAVFQGLGVTPVFGRNAVLAYYARVPVGTSARARPLHAYRLGNDVVAGMADVLFTGAGEADRPVTLSLVLYSHGGTWRIRHYHASDR